MSKFDKCVFVSYMIIMFLILVIMGMTIEKADLVNASTLEVTEIPEKAENFNSKDFFTETIRIGTRKSKKAVESEKNGVVEDSEDSEEVVEEDISEIPVEEVGSSVDISKIDVEQIEEVAEVVEVEPTYSLSDYERWVVECIVMGESGAESYTGQMLVAQCILNGCLKEGIAPSQLRVKYQYSGWNENVSESVKEAVEAVFVNGEVVTEEFILYFYAPKYGTSSWHESQKWVITEGGHKFFAGW